MRLRDRRVAVALLVVLLGGGAGCRSAYNRAYYGTMEAFGKEKRDLLVDRVENARDSQEETKEQFESALEQFSRVVGFDGGDLEDLYERLEREHGRSAERADEVGEHINAVERVADDLFFEWGEELDQYENQDLRRASEEQRRDARRRYDEMMRAMRRAESKMPPVLEAFEDQVLYLKHNLNARAISSLEGTLDTLESDIAALVLDMNESIEEANRFIGEMQS